MAFALSSPAFNEGRPIPPLYTCEGKDISPPLAWNEAAAGTESFALIGDDPDAPGGVWVHWLLYNLPPSTRSLKEAFPHGAKLADGSCQLRNDSGDIGYGGPCPPGGVHRYYFKLYALDAVLSLQDGAGRKQLEQAMQGRVLAETRLMGTYHRKGR